MSESPSLNSGESREIKETIGDNYNVECPHCGKQNHNICYGDTNPSKENPTEFWKPCQSCKKDVYYKAKRGKEDKHGFPTIEIFAYSEYPDAGFGM